MRRADLRLNILVLIIAGWGLAILVTLWYVQVVKGETYEKLSAENRIRLVRIPAPRGIISDRFGRVLADNRPGFEAVVNLPEVKDREKLIAALAEILHIDSSQINSRLDTFRERPFEPVRVASDIGIGKAIVLEEGSHELQGLRIQVNPIRNYPYGERMAHLLGYVGQISARELGDFQEYGYRPQDDIGKIGVEEAFDQYLKGEAGGEQLQVDARGYRDRLLTHREPEPGNNIQLTVDLRAQLILDELMTGWMGAAVALDPRNGDVLAMVSKPGFDPNLMVRPIQEDYLEALFSDPQSPLINRVIAGEYPPGSPLKLVVALSALSGGTITPKTTFDCPGGIALGGRRFRCWREGGHGPLALEEAIKYSCNVFFYKTSLEVGADKIIETALRLGLGEKTTLGLKGERAGFVPSRQWKKTACGEFWYPGDTVNLSIGQGYILVTPLQMANLGCIIANEGTLYHLRPVSRISSLKGETVQEFPPQVERKLEIPSWIWGLIKSGMFRAVNEPGGTGNSASHPRIAISGKTGTAQVGGVPEYQTDAWFLCFAPSDEPEIVLTVILEGGKSGAEAAAPLAGEFLRRYFED